MRGPALISLLLAVLAGCGRRAPLGAASATGGAPGGDASGGGGAAAAAANGGASAAGTGGGAGTTSTSDVVPDAGATTPDASPPVLVDASSSTTADAEPVVQELHGWVSRTPAMLPESWPQARRRPAVVYDPKAKRLVVYGGTAYAEPLRDTWAWNGTTGLWTRLVVTPPPAFDMAGATWNDAEGSVMLFGGRTSLTAPPSNGLWRLTLDWNEVAPPWLGAPWPPAQPNVLMAYDAARAQLVLLGSGTSRSTWAWNVVDHTWGDESTDGPSANAPLTFTGAFAWDERRHVGVYFGDQAWGETWEWSGVDGTWTRKTFSVSNAPSPRRLSAAAYDSDAGRVMLFAGSPIDSPGAHTWVNDLWEWDGTSWKLFDTGSVPSDREAHGLAYDSDRHCLVTFGGSTPFAEMNDLWEWHR